MPLSSNGKPSPSFSLMGSKLQGTVPRSKAEINSNSRPGGKLPTAMASKHLALTAAWMCLVSSSLKGWFGTSTCLAAWWQETLECLFAMAKAKLIVCSCPWLMLLVLVLISCRKHIKSRSTAANKQRLRCLRWFLDITAISVQVWSW